MATIHNLSTDMIRNVGDYLAGYDGLHLKLASKDMKEAFKETKFEKPNFFKGDDGCTYVRIRQIYNGKPGNERLIPTNQLRFAGMSRRRKMINGKLNIVHIRNEYVILTENDNFFECDWDNPDYDEYYGPDQYSVSKEDYYQIKHDYYIYKEVEIAKNKALLKKKEEEDKKKAEEAEYARKHPVVKIKGNATPTNPWKKI